ncbi:MAG: GTP 3',8-cyclase MoaA [Lachnospiraceae bacterium]|nr:GTP 3',8-cyclase MoaA [Lachnospiraceae bacterium]
MIDLYGRTIDYLRVSITDRCNLRCRYCLPGGEETVAADQERYLNLEEVLRVCQAAERIGIRKFKITGGEPLVRQDCLELIRRLKELPETEAVTLTTNGVLLKRALPELKRLSIDGINVSLDTLKPERFSGIAGLCTDGRETWKQVFEAVKEGAALGIPMKINCVPIRGLNEDEILDFVALTRELPVDVRFIELMPIGAGKAFRGMSRLELLEVIRNAWPEFQKTEEKRGNGPAVYGRIPGSQGCVGFIEAIHGKFCGSCNRLRLTSEGFLKPCLYYKKGVELKTLLRKEAGNEKLEEALRQAVLQKPESHHFQEKDPKHQAEERFMARIGG